MSDNLIVSLSDGSITGVEGTVWVKDWPDNQGDQDDYNWEDDLSDYAEHHGISLTNIIEFATKVATLDKTLDKGIDPTLNDLIVEARALIGEDR